MAGETRLSRSWHLGLGIVCVAGLALRLFYAVHANLYIDEFTTIWAAQRALIHGLPRFPLGAVYTQGLLYTYLESAALVLGGGFHPLFARLPSLLLSAATLAALIVAVRLLFRVPPAGLAALWLAMDSEAILWGGRARTYTLLQMLVLLAFVGWYRGAVAEDRPRLRWLAIGLLALALIEQPLTLILLPPLAILALAARGWRWLRRPVVWLQAGAMLGCLLARQFLYRLMVLPGTSPTAEPRAFVDLTQPFAEWRTLAPFFTDPSHALALLLLLVGAAWVLLRRPRTASWRGPVLAITFLLLFAVLEMLFVVGPTWRRPRYLFPVLPMIYLGAEGVALAAWRALAARFPILSRRGHAVAIPLALLVAIVALALPNALAAARQNEWGYDRALAFVDQNWAEGDAVATIAPVACLVVLGHCDYLAVEEGAQALMVQHEGRTVDSWTGLPFLESAERLATALETDRRLWFVVDEMRLDRHFGPEYLELLWERFDLVAFEWGTFVFRSRSATPAPSVERAMAIDLAGELSLAGFVVDQSRPQPGDTVTVTLRWAALAPTGEYVAYVHLIDPQGRTVAAQESPILGGLYPPFRWQWSPGSQPFPDRHALALPSDLPPGRYRLDAGLKRAGADEAVGQPVTVGFLAVRLDADLPPNPPAARFGDPEQAALLAYRLDGTVAPGSTATLHLLWQAGSAGLDTDYTVFIHLLDGSGQITQQWDLPPTGGWYPTSFWLAGEAVADDHLLPFGPQLPPGSYRLILGLYRADGARLPLDNGASFLDLGAIDLSP